MQQKTKYIVLFLIFLTCTIAYKTNVPENIDMYIFDKSNMLLFQNKKITPNSTIIIQIDDESLKALGQWPWSRLVLTKALQKIAQNAPAAIGLDIIFSEPDRTSPKYFENFYKNQIGIDANIYGIPKNLYDNDKVFADTIEQTNAVLPFILTKKKFDSQCKIKNHLQTDKLSKSIPEFQNALCNINPIQKAINNSGFINAFIGENTTLRKYNIFVKYKEDLVPSLALAMLQSIDSNLHVRKNGTVLHSLSINFLNHSIKSDENGQLFNHIYPKNSFTVIPMIKFLTGEVNSSIVSGKFVLIGANATGLSDNHITSTGEKIPGVLTHAALIENIINDSLIYTYEKLKIIMMIISFLFVGLISMLFWRKRYIHVTLGVASLCVMALVISQLFLSSGIYLSIGYFIFPLLLSYCILLLFTPFFSLLETKRYERELLETRLFISNSLMNIVETRDSDTGKHITRTKEYAQAIVEYLLEHNLYKTELTKEQSNLIYRATPLHDIGKIGIPDSILQKEDKLTKEEYEAMKQHSQIGYNIITTSMDQNALNSNQFLRVSANIAYTHHEKWDGSGYPQGLVGTKIPLEGRIVALADVYDALISKRCYKDSMSFETAEEIILDGKGKHFDPIIVDAFWALKDTFRKIANENMD